MKKVIYFNNDDQKKDYCEGKVYSDFIDYAFEECNYFMLVYVNYYGKGYSKIMKDFKNALKPYKVKSRTNPSWPGVLGTICPDTTYKIIFYRNDLKAKELLKQVSKLSDWTRPHYPQDLAFFKGNKCWSFSVGHEKIAGIVDATDKDMNFLISNNLVDKDDLDMVIDDDGYYDAYDESIE